MYNLTKSEICFLLLILLATGAIFFIVLINPYKIQFMFFVRIDHLLILSFIVTFTSVSMARLAFDWDEIGPTFGLVLTVISTLVPFLYLTVLLSKSMVQLVFKKGRCLKQTVVFVRKWRAEPQVPISDRENQEEVGVAEQLIPSVN